MYLLYMHAYRKVYRCEMTEPQKRQNMYIHNLSLIERFILSNERGFKIVKLNEFEWDAIDFFLFVIVSH